MPILANDPHREVVNPALRYLVHLVAPGWNALGATEPGLPGITIGHNEKVAWGFTILGIDQQDLYVEETHPGSATRYRHKQAWLDMKVERELIYVKGQAAPVEYQVKLTRHGPVLHEDLVNHRAFSLRWVGAEPGGAGYLGSLHVMQAGNWEEFNEAVSKAWYIPSHSLVYADVAGNIGYRGVGLTPVRKGWDGLLPVPGSDDQYEWQGFVPYDRLPSSFNTPKHFYNSSNNDVVPRILPSYTLPLGYEYSPPFRYDRVAEVLGANRKFSVASMQELQHDTLSLPARELVPLLARVKTDDADLTRAIGHLLAWERRVSRDSVAATIYEFWVLDLMRLAYQPRIPEPARSTFRRYDIERVIKWMTAPDAAYGASPKARAAARDGILLAALREALARIRRDVGDDMERWRWGDIHTADFIHPLAAKPETRTLFNIDPVGRGGDGYTVMNTSSPTEAGAKQQSGATFMFVLDLKDWDESRGLSVPGNSAQPASPHYGDLVAKWAAGEYFPLAFSRRKVDEVTRSRLVLEPLVESPGAGTSPGEPQFEPVQPELFDASGAQPNCFADFDNDGDLDMFVGFRRGTLNRLYRNDGGRFTDVAPEMGVADDHGTRSCAWGDFNADGHLDLYVGFALTSGIPNKLYRNDGDGKHFTEVGRATGVDAVGESRQVSWVDFDRDGDVDLFVAFRNRPNALYRNDGRRFTDVAKLLGLDDPRRTVGAVWFDMEEDGDLDLFDANQNGDTDGFYRNDGAWFVDVAGELGMDAAGRPAAYGGVGPAVGDFDNDGRLDLYVANYGPNFLWRNEGSGRFRDVAPATGVAGDYHAVTPTWGDFDNDGRLDLYVTTALANVINFRDYLYRNDGERFSDVTPAVILKNDATQAAHWIDFDRDGDLDLALANNEPGGKHYLFRNLLPPDRASRSIQVLVLDGAGRYTTAGSEVRVYAAGTRRLLGARLVETLSGYCSQSVAPVHVGLPSAGPVDVEVTFLTKIGRQVTRASGVDPGALAGRALVIKAPGR